MSYITFIVLLTILPGTSELKIECTSVVRSTLDAPVTRVYAQGGYGTLIALPESEHAAEMAYCAKQLSLPAVLTPCIVTPTPGGGGTAVCE